MISRGMQALETESYPRCFLETALSHDKSLDVPTTPPTHVQYYMPEEEIRYVGVHVHVHVVNIVITMTVIVC